MIARIWHGAVPEAQGEAYTDFLDRIGIRDYLATPGNRGVKVLRRTEGGLTHFLLVTFWESEEAIRRFAGDDLLRARYYPEDDGFLIEKEAEVVHYEVIDLPGTSPDHLSPASQ